MNHCTPNPKIRFLKNVINPGKTIHCATATNFKSAILTMILSIFDTISFRLPSFSNLSSSVRMGWYQMTSKNNGYKLIAVHCVCGTIRSLICTHCMGWLMGLTWSLICGKRLSGKQGEHDVPHELLISFTIREPN